MQVAFYVRVSTYQQTNAQTIEQQLVLSPELIDKKGTNDPTSAEL